MHCQQYANVKFSSNRSCRELGTVTRLKVLDRAYSTDSIGHTCCTWEYHLTSAAILPSSCTYWHAVNQSGLVPLYYSTIRLRQIIIVFQQSLNCLLIDRNILIFAFYEKFIIIPVLMHLKKIYSLSAKVYILLI